MLKKIEGKEKVVNRALAIEMLMNAFNRTFDVGWLVALDSVSSALVKEVKRLAEINGVEPYAYLKDVLTRVWTTPQSQIDPLMPRMVKAVKGPPNSS